MPTGYTSDVKDGKINDFKTFALRCARAFGALVEMRDDSLDASIRENKISPYYEENLIRSKQEYNNVVHWSFENALLAQQDEIRQQEKEQSEIRNKMFLTRQRYNEMLSKVKEWDPPTSEHFGLKNFMINQLEESIKSDCDPSIYEIETFLSPEEYKHNKLQRIYSDIVYYENKKKEEEERVTERNKWIKDLIGSL